MYDRTPMRLTNVSSYVKGMVEMPSNILQKIDMILYNPRFQGQFKH